MNVPLLDKLGQIEGEFILDQAIPGYVTIDPVTGAIGAAFTGKVTALGLTLPEGNSSTPPDTNRVRWVDDITNPTSPERSYIFGTSFRGVDATDYETKMALQDGLGGDTVTLELYETGSGHLPPTPTYQVKVGMLGSKVNLFACDNSGNLIAKPIIQNLPVNGSVISTPATVVPDGVDYGIIKMSQFPPTASPQHGDRVVCRPDGTNAYWAFMYDANLGAWACVGGTPVLFSSSSSTTLPTSSWTAMGFTYTLVRGGVYNLGGTLTGAGSTTGASTQQVGLLRSGVLLPFPSISFSTPSPSYGWNGTAGLTPVSINAGQTVDIAAWSNGVNATVSEKQMQVMPAYIV